MGVVLLMLLAAAAAHPSDRAAGSAPACATFASYQHNQMLPPVSKVGNLTVSSVPSNPIKIYDPANDGLKGAKGATMADSLMFETDRSDFRKFRISWMSFTPGYTLLTATNAQGVVLRKAKLNGSVQQKPLTYSASGKGVSRLILENAGRESIVSEVCFSE